MVDSIQPNSVSGVDEDYESSQELNQELVNQLLMFILGCNTQPKNGSSPQEDALKMELTQREASLPPQQAAQLKNLLSRLPLDTGSITYQSEVIEAFSKITAFVVTVMPNGLSSKAAEGLQILFQGMPTDTGSQVYAEQVDAWVAKVSAYIASHLPGVLSPTDQKELDVLFEKMPTDTSSKEFPSQMKQFIDTIQVFLAEHIPSSLSPTDKDRLSAQLKEVQSIDPSAPGGPEGLQIASADLQQLLSEMFFYFS